jgi:hypothetical protein
LPKPPEAPVMTMVRGTLASYVEVTSWDTLRSLSPRPNPQKLLVLARDPLIVAPRPGSGWIADDIRYRYQGPGP